MKIVIPRTLNKTGGDDFIINLHLSGTQDYPEAFTLRDNPHIYRPCPPWRDIRNAKFYR